MCYAWSLSKRDNNEWEKGLGPAVQGFFLREQVDAGAEVILTQPPLLRRQFEAWYEGLSRQEYGAQRLSCHI